MTVDGSFPLGAAVCVVFVSNNVNPWLALVAATAAGALAGLVTGIIHVKCRVRDLLSGIITMTVLYSVNLHIAGSANVNIMSNETIFKNEFLIDIFGGFNTLAVVLAVCAAAKIIMDLYLKTKSGYLLRAVGDNPSVVVTLAKNSGTVKIIGLVIANALVALSGAVMCQQQRFFEISMGTGAIVIGLASVIIGTNVFKKASFIKDTGAVIVGSVLYKACVAGAFKLGLDPTDMKLITGVLFLVILIAGNFKKGGAENA